MRYSYLQIEKYIADKITSLCEKRDISKYRLSQLSGISQLSLGRIITQENLPSLIALEKICTALGVTLSQFFFIRLKAIIRKSAKRMKVCDAKL